MESAPVPKQANQVETVIDEKRSLDVDAKPLRLWEESGDYTLFLISWCARPKHFSITQVFVDELRRRQGLKAYGVRVAPRRRSKINQLTSGLELLKPRELVDPSASQVAKPQAA